MKNISLGTVVGNITVTGRTDQRKNGYMVWRCVCNCGNEILLDTRTLQRETVKDCGCITRVKPGQRDLTGMRFGKLTCVRPETARDGQLSWWCRCDCGRECVAASGQLTKGYRKSCGCLKSAANCDLTGQQFGRLTAEEYAGTVDHRRTWRCSCSCGATRLVPQSDLLSGKTTSCGCRARETQREVLELIDGSSIRIIRDSLSGRLRSTNTSGFTGVNQCGDCWRARICFQGVDHHLGVFETREDAIAARVQGEELFRDFLTEHGVEIPEREIA